MTRTTCLCVFVCVLSSRCLVCRPSHLCVCRVGTPPARKYVKSTEGLVGFCVCGIRLLYGFKRLKGKATYGLWLCGGPRARGDRRSVKEGGREGGREIASPPSSIRLTITPFSIHRALKLW